MFLGAHVLLPEGWDTHPQARYPARRQPRALPYDFDGFRETLPTRPEAVHSDRFNWPGYNRPNRSTPTVLQGLDGPGFRGS